jgi:hypothetical protein
MMVSTTHRRDTQAFTYVTFNDRGRLKPREFSGFGADISWLGTTTGTRDVLSTFLGTRMIVEYGDQSDELTLYIIFCGLPWNW